MAARTNIKINPQLMDFKNFQFLVWKHLNLPAPTEIQYDIADYLQDKGLDAKVKRKIIEAFRGAGKSYILIAYVLWRLYLNPDEKILVVSKSVLFASTFVKQTRALIGGMSILKHLVPRNDQRDNSLGFDVDGCNSSPSPSVRSAGINGQITGSRASIIIADDVETPGNSATQVQREKLSELVKEFDSILMPGGEIIYLGTPQTIESLYNKLKRRGYAVRIWTARYPKDIKNLESYGDEIAPIIRDRLLNDSTLHGQPVDIKRFNDEDLKERELSLGRSTFQLQFMLDTTLSDAEKYPLKQEDFIVLTLDKDQAPVKVVWGNNKEDRLDNLPNFGFTGDRWYRPFFSSEEWSNYTGSVMAIDPSGLGKDETAYAVVKHLNGILYITDVGGLQGGYTKENLVKLANVAFNNRVNLIITESNFGGGMFTELLKPILGAIYPCTVEEVRHNTQKEKRIIDTLEPVLNQHRLVIDLEIIRRRNFDDESQEELKLDYNLLYQLTHLTKDRGSLVHDDRLDALSMAVAYWKESMAQSNSDAIENYKREQFDKELNKFMEAAGVIYGRGTDLLWN